MKEEDSVRKASVLVCSRKAVSSVKAATVHVTTVESRAAISHARTATATVVAISSAPSRAAIAHV